MPSGKDRSKEDTWKESDLKKALKDDKKKPRDDRKSKERSSHRDEDRRERKDREDDRKKRDHEVASGSKDSRRPDRERDREPRKRDEDKDRERTREKARERDKDKEKDRRREKDGERSKESSDRTRETREREKSGERRKEKESDDKERHRDRDKRRERDADKEAEKGSKEKSRSDKDRRSEGRHERDKERDGSRDRRKEREREDRGKEKTKERDRDKDRERGRDRLEKENKDSDKDERRRRRERHDKENHDSDKDGKRREHHRSRNEDGSRERRHDDRKDDRRERTRDDKDRRKERSEGADGRDKDKVRRREQEMLDSLKKEEELTSKRKESPRFRSDTLEEADTVEEDIEQRRRASLQKVPSIGGAEEFNDEGAGGYDYEEDFEDYEEDFEDDGDEEDEDDTGVDLQEHAGMQELLQAINAENQDARLSSREGSKELIETHKETSRSPTASSSRGRINFVAAQQKQITDKVASRTRRRGQELMHLIDLDVAAFDIFDLPPLNEYELYIKNFGRSDTKQAYVQCNEDNVEREVQTEEIETRTKWTQNPATDAAGFGDEEDESEDDLSTLTEKANIDSLRLSKFLQRAAQTCLILLEEETSEQTNTQFKDRKDMSCSDGFIQLSSKHSYLEGRSVQCVHISPVQTHLLLVAYGPVTEQAKVSSKTDTNVQDKGVVCVWNTNEPSKPQKVLACESVPTCCCLSPSKATLAFAGLEDGSLVAWDLRETSSMHYSSTLTDGDSQVIVRLPTFSTAGVLGKDESHLSPVTSLLPVVMPGDRLMLQEISSAASARASGGTNLMSDDMLGLSFQLASLEENATISIWVVVELDKANTAGSESDLGLSPGGKIKLIKSSSVSLQSPFRDFRKNLSLQALVMRFLPDDPNHIYVGTGGGYILHCLRHGGRAPPKAYRPETESLVDIPVLDVSPWQLPCFLAGSRDGTLWLYNLKNETPLSTWSISTDGSAIVSLRWSRSKPSVFYVLDAASRLHIWDLLKSDRGPVAVEKFKHGRVVCFELSSDYSASGIGIPGRSPELVLAYESGAVEVHRLSGLFTNAAGDELDKFASYLDAVL